MGPRSEEEEEGRGGMARCGDGVKSVMIVRRRWCGAWQRVRVVPTSKEKVGMLDWPQARLSVTQPLGLSLRCDGDSVVAVGRGGGG